MDWKIFRVYAVFASNQPLNAWVFLRTGAEIGDWRRIQPNSADGVSNVLQIATAACYNDQDFVLCLMSDTDEIIAISK